MVSIGPSLMCGDLGALREDIKILDRNHVDFFHIDIMDGNFVPNYTMGTDMIKSIRNDTLIPFDAHLMVEEPDRYIEMFANAGCDMISVHEEASTHLYRTLQNIKNRGVKAGLALNPHTSIESLKFVADVVDYVVIMTVNPGFAGQMFIPSMLKKIEETRDFINSNHLDIDIQVDGNISFDIIPKVLERGATMLVCGTSCLYKQEVDLDRSVKRLQSFLDGVKTI